VENTSKNKKFPLVSSEGVVLTKDNLAKKIGKGANNVSAVILMRPFSSCF
jgi:hypothetical protein